MLNAQKLWKGALSGAVAGLAASWTMNQFQLGWSKVQKKASGGEESQGEDETATMAAANLAAEKVLDRELSKEEKKKAAPYFHYGFGTLMGALYGIAAEGLPASTAGFGTAYGTGLFLVADEGMVPILKLSKSAKEYPVSSHLEALASHLVYGASLESARRGLRAALGKGSGKAAKEVLETAKQAVHWEVETRGPVPKLEKAKEKAKETVRKTLARAA